MYNELSYCTEQELGVNSLMQSLRQIPYDTHCSQENSEIFGSLGGFAAFISRSTLAVVVMASSGKPDDH